MSDPVWCNARGPTLTGPQRCGFSGCEGRRKLVNGSWIANDFVHQHLDTDSSLSAQEIQTIRSVFDAIIDVGIEARSERPLYNAIIQIPAVHTRTATIFRLASDFAVQFPLRPTGLFFGRSCYHHRAECLASETLGPFRSLDSDTPVGPRQPCNCCTDKPESEFRSFLFVVFRGHILSFLKEGIPCTGDGQTTPPLSETLLLFQTLAQEVYHKGMTAPLYQQLQDQIWANLELQRENSKAQLPLFNFAPIGDYIEESTIHGRLECAIAHCPANILLDRFSATEKKRMRPYLTPCPSCTTCSDEQLLESLLDGTLAAVFAARSIATRAPLSSDRRFLEKTQRESMARPNETVAQRKRRFHQQKMKDDPEYHRQHLDNRRKRTANKAQRLEDCLRRLTPTKYDKYLTRLKEDTLSNAPPLKATSNLSDYQILSTAVRGAWADISSNVETKGKSEDMSFAEYVDVLLIEHSCFWCKRPYSELDGLLRLDRKQNDGGYGIERVLASCTSCNMMRGSLTMDGFLLACREICDFQDRGIPSTHLDITASTEPYGLWKLYNEKKRHIKVQLDEPCWRKIMGSACHYCGVKRAAGVDRLRSELKVYSTENCVPCCKRCNFMKRETPVREFLERAAIIIFSAMEMQIIPISKRQKMSLPNLTL